MPDNQEKKVEYLELIYDLIFVYLIGRNNEVLRYVEDGFVSGRTVFAFILCSLAVIQIWNFSTIYINLYGRNNVREHVFLFSNMYLLYHMADGIRTGWHDSFYQFCIAWALILANIGLQHLIEMRQHKAEPRVLEMLKRKALIIFGEVVLILVHMLVYTYTGVTIAYVPILFGFVANAASRKVNLMVPVDFNHLTERAMLYVVFTFGEITISLTGYFGGNVTANGVYFSLMAFLIVVGLFLIYEIMYNKIVDRDMTTNGTTYMMIHVFLILALSGISVALEFMREAEVDITAKTLFIAGSILIYFVCILLLGIYARSRECFNRQFFIITGVTGVAFLVLMFIFRNNMYLNIAVSVVYVMTVFFMLYKRSKNCIME